VEAAAAALRERGVERPDVAVVLGSGLGAAADLAVSSLVIDCGELPHWPRAEVPGHQGTLTIGRVGDRQVAVLAGRVHLYEGHSLDDVVFATRVMGRLGVKQLILSNAAGGINPGFTAGTLMVIDDHLNLLGGSPLTGPNDDRLGPRFPDMSEVYSQRLRAIVDGAALDAAVPLVHGIYAAVPGPSYETPAEVRYLRTLGADAVGMSTVPEAVAARHMGMEVLGLSCITNLAAGIGAHGHRLTHDEVIATAQAASARVSLLLRATLGRL
jgi:purine-nucleoside phosphorylase